MGALLEDVFTGREIHCITIVHNPRGIQGNNFSYTHEYAYFVFRKNLKVIGHREIKEEDIQWRNLRDNGGKSLRSDAKNCFYPIIVKNEKIFGNEIYFDYSFIIIINSHICAKYPGGLLSS